MAEEERGTTEIEHFPTVIRSAQCLDTYFLKKPKNPKNPKNPGVANFCNPKNP